MDSTEPSRAAFFVFGPLKLSQSIRILQLAPAPAHDDSLIARLVEEPLEDSEDAVNPDYEALSYTWGTDPPTETLLIEDGPGHDVGGISSSSLSALAITPSLAAALRRFRQPDAVRRLWVDAVCINQSDNGEKSAQVARMAVVYRRARRVLIWLGEATCESELALATLAAVAARSEEFGLKKEETSWLRFGKKLQGEFMDVYGVLQTTLQVRLGDVLGRSWFTRLWIVQEVVLAAEAVLHVGEHEMAWNVFTTGMVVLKAGMATAKTRIGASADDFAAFERAWVVVSNVAQHKVWQHVFGGVYAEVRGVLAGLVGQRCSDERDRIYAITYLGLRGLKQHDIMLGSGESVSTELAPDYTKSVARTYLDFARHMAMQSDVNLLLDAGLSRRLSRSDWGKTLTSVHDPSSADRGGPLPSWVPDLSDPKTFHSETWNDPNGEFEAGGLMRWARAAQIDNPRHLWVRVRPLGLVRRLLSVHGLIAYGPAEDLSGPVRSFWEAAKAEADLAFYNRYESQNNLLLQALEGISHEWTAMRRVEALREAFARTLTGDGKGIVFRHEFSSVVSRRDVYAFFQAYWRCSMREDGELRRRWAAWISGGLNTTAAEGNDAQRFYEGLSDEARLAYRFETALQNTLADHRFLITTDGFIGIAPAMAEPGDMVVLIAGLAVPYILRKIGQKPYLEDNGDGEGDKDGDNSGQHRRKASLDSDGEDGNKQTQQFVAIGPAYVHGFMYGEGALSGESGVLPSEWIMPSPEFRYVCLM